MYWLSLRILTPRCIGTSTGQLRQPLGVIKAHVQVYQSYEYHPLYRKHQCWIFIAGYSCTADSLLPLLSDRDRCLDRERTVGDSVRVWEIQRLHLRKECNPPWNRPQAVWKYFQEVNTYDTETFAAHETATAEVPTWSEVQERIGYVSGRYVEPSVQHRNETR